MSYPFPELAPELLACFTTIAEDHLSPCLGVVWRVFSHGPIGITDAFNHLYDRNQTGSQFFDCFGRIVKLSEVAGDAPYALDGDISIDEVDSVRRFAARRHGCTQTTRLILKNRFNR